MTSSLDGEVSQKKTSDVIHALPLSRLPTFVHNLNLQTTSLVVLYVISKLDSNSRLKHLKNVSKMRVSFLRFKFHFRVTIYSQQNSIFQLDCSDEE